MSTAIPTDRKTAAIAAFPDLADANDAQWDALSTAAASSPWTPSTTTTGASLRVVLESTDEAIVVGPDGSVWE